MTEIPPPFQRVDRTPLAVRHQKGCLRRRGFAICRAVSALNQRQESNRRYTIFDDSTSAITQAGDNALGTGQCFAVAAIDVCSRILARENNVTIGWVSAHCGAEGNEVAGRCTNSAATGEDPVEDIPERYAAEISLSHMTSVATEARSRAMSE